MIEIDNNKLITVIVPVYNVQEYINECVDSIICQTYDNLEIILVDDGSTDNSCQICDEYLSKDPRIKVIHKSNGGLSSARNVGLDCATGNYIGFVDSDDVIESHMYENLYEVLYYNNAEVAICGKTTMFNCLGKDNGCIEVLNRENALKEMTLTLKYGSHVCDKLFHRKLFDNIRFPEGKTYEDLYTTYKCISKAGRIVYVGKKLYYYRENELGITKKSFSKSNMNIIYGNINLLNYYRMHYPKLVPYSKMAIAKSSVAMLRKMIDTSSYDEKYARQLIEIVKDNFIFLLISPYNIKAKLFALAMIFFPKFGTRIYKKVEDV